MSCSISVPAAESSLKVLRQKQFTAKNKQAEFDLHLNLAYHVTLEVTFTIDNQFLWHLVIFSPPHPPLLFPPFHKTSLLCICLLFQGWLRPQEASENEYGEEDHGEARQEECSPQDNALGLMHLRRLSPSSATRRATWHKKSRRRSSTWCCLFSTGWERDGCLHKATASS